MTRVPPTTAIDAETDAADIDVCGAELTDGSRCDRPEEECQYHG